MQPLPGDSKYPSVHTSHKRPSTASGQSHCPSTQLRQPQSKPSEQPQAGRNTRRERNYESMMMFKHLSSTSITYIQHTRYIKVLLTQAGVVFWVMIHRTLVTVLSQKRPSAIAVTSKIVTITRILALAN